MCQDVTDKVERRVGFNVYKYIPTEYIIQKRFIITCSVELLKNNVTAMFAYMPLSVVDLPLLNF